jgi:hypothetical protein
VKSFGFLIPVFVAAMLLCAGARTVAAQRTTVSDTAVSANGTRTASVGRAEQPLVIDGRLEEAAWQRGVALNGFVQREPFEGRAVSERTEVRVVYDDVALYIGAWLFDSEPSGIVFSETRRDADLSDSDAFRVVLDTYLDRQNGFVFATTPAGIEYDGQVTREGQGGFTGQLRQQAGSGGGFNVNWDGSWEVATSRDSSGWYAEFRIPFATLRYGRAGPQRWGINFARAIRRKYEESVWSPLPRQFDLYRVSSAGIIEGFEAPAQRPISATPYVLGSGRKDYVTGADTDFKGEVGGDAKIGLGSALTLDLTVNTDFAQVEVDDEQINLTRFRLFFPEKRPFFLENAGTFSVGTPQEVEVFFSRRIGIESGAAVPILGGGRLTGKAAGLTLGVLDIQTERLRITEVDGERVELAPPENFAVARVIKELPNRSRLGAIGLSRLNTSDSDDTNFTYGLDGRLNVGQALMFDAYYARTASPHLRAGEHAFSASGSLTARNWSAGAVFREVGEGFNPEVGFLPRSAYRFVSARILRNVRVPSLTWFRELRPHVTYREFFDLDGFSETRLIHIDSHFEFANGAFFQLPAINFTREGLKEPFEISPGIVVTPGTYDNFEWGFEYRTNQSAPVAVSGRIDIGGFYSGHRWGTASTLDTRLSDVFAAAVRVTYYNITLDEGEFENRLLSLRAAYSFSPRTYLQALVQYNDQTETFSGNLRFGWLNTAGTGLFLVYNDIENTGSLERTGVRRGPLDRTFVIKYTRQFDLMR